MSIMSRIACGLAAIGLGALALPAHAQEGTDSWFYLGASVGQVETTQGDRYYAPFRTYPWGDDVTLDLIAESGVDLRSTSRTERVHAGYRANRFLAFEAGYADLGGSEQATFCPGTLTADMTYCLFESYGRSRSTTRRADFTVHAIVPLGEHFELMGKLGLARTRHTTYWEHGSNHTDVEYFTGRVYGVGARFFLAPAWALRLDVDRSEVPADMANHHPEDKRIDSLWFGLEYGFR